MREFLETAKFYMNIVCVYRIIFIYIAVQYSPY